MYVRVWLFSILFLFPTVGLSAGFFDNLNSATAIRCQTTEGLMTICAVVGGERFPMTAGDNGELVIPYKLRNGQSSVPAPAQVVRQVLGVYQQLFDNYRAALSGARSRSPFDPNDPRSFRSRSELALAREVVRHNTGIDPFESATFLDRRTGQPLPPASIPPTPAQPGSSQLLDGAIIEGKESNPTPAPDPAGQPGATAPATPSAGVSQLLQGATGLSPSEAPSHGAASPAADGRDNVASPSGDTPRPAFEPPASLFQRWAERFRGTQSHPPDLVALQRAAAGASPTGVITIPEQCVYEGTNRLFERQLAIGVAPDGQTFAQVVPGDRTTRPTLSELRRDGVPLELTGDPPPALRGSRNIPGLAPTPREQIALRTYSENGAEKYLVQFAQTTGRNDDNPLESYCAAKKWAH